MGGIEPPLPGPRPGALPLRDTPIECGARYRVIPGGSFPIFRRTQRVFRYGVLNGQACTRGSQGRQELNPHFAGFGDRLPIRWLIPKQAKTAPRGFPWDGCRQVPPGAYTTTIRPIKAAASCETGFMYPARLGVCRIVISPW